MIDARIIKPRVRLRAGSLVASTDELLRASGLEYELLESTEARTPLGRVLIARLLQAGPIEVAGPSVAAQVRDACEAMLALGAAQVLVDGAIDRRAASSPEVCDALVMATGAVLSHELEEVVSLTRDAVALARLPAPDRASPAIAEALALFVPDARSRAAYGGDGDGALLSGDGEIAPLPARFVLRAGAGELAALFDAHPDAQVLLIAGALPERFLEELRPIVRRSGRALTIVVADATRVFLSGHGVDWYRRQGLDMRAAAQVDLRALTVNPVAPQSHRFDSRELREALQAALQDVPVLDVCHPDYPAAPAPVA